MTIGTKQNICIGFYDTEGLTQPLCFVYPCVFTCTPFSDISKLLIFHVKTSCVFGIFIYAVIRRQKTIKPSQRLGFTTMHSKWSLYWCGRRDLTACGALLAGCLLGSPPGRLRTIRDSNVHRTFELRSCPHRFESLPFSYENKKTSKWRGYIKKSLLPLVL